MQVKYLIYDETEENLPSHHLLKCKKSKDKNVLNATGSYI